jgi:acetyl esterase/lipase
LQSLFLNGVLHVLRPKRQWKSAAAVRHRVNKLEQRPATHHPSALGREVQVNLREWAGWPVYHTVPSLSPETSNHVVFLHGGGFINEIVSAHWRFVGCLTRDAPARCVVPIFPVAPQGKAVDVVPAVGNLLRELLESGGPANVSIVGQSAGAGLALAAAQWLRDSGFPQPKILILVSPLLDASVGGEEQAAIAPRDLILDVPGLAEAGRLYAGTLDVRHPLVSPVNGDLHGLAPMIVFSGTRDLLHPDSVALAEKARQADAPIDLQVERGLPHSYPLLPTPEGRRARAIIAYAVRREPEQVS